MAVPAFALISAIGNNQAGRRRSQKLVFELSPRSIVEQTEGVVRFGGGSNHPSGEMSCRQWCSRRRAGKPLPTRTKPLGAADACGVGGRGRVKSIAEKEVLCDDT